MKPDKTNRVNLSRALRDILLEASEEELKEALDDSMQDFDELAEIGQSIVTGALMKTKDDDSIIDLRKGLGALINMLRRKDKISIDELASKARVDSSEIRNIENDPGFDPNPRTIVQLERYFDLVPRSLVVLSGAVRVHGDVSVEAARFAASSENISGLSREELKLLNRFVRLLRDYTDQ